VTNDDLRSSPDVERPPGSERVDRSGEIVMNPPFSSTAIKAAAHVLKSSLAAESGLAARRALLAALRADHPRPVTDILPDEIDWPDIDLWARMEEAGPEETSFLLDPEADMRDLGLDPDGSIAWIFGDRRSGASEVLHTHAKRVLRQGWLPIIIDLQGNHLLRDRWSEADMNIFFDPERPITEEIIEEMLDPAAGKGGLFILSPDKRLPDGETEIAMVEKILSFASGLRREDSVVFIDGVVHPLDFVSIIMRGGVPPLRFILRAEHFSDVDHGLIWDGEIVLHMHQRYDTFPEGHPASFFAPYLEAGDAFMDCMHRNLVLNYEEPSRPARTELDEGPLSRLERALRDGRPVRTHTERLETVSRAFGFRSWHAAQGCTKNGVSQAS
jgi:hypothetical protein